MEAAHQEPVSERAVIGRSITIVGEVSGDEDLLVQGKVEGSMDLEKNALTIGGDGKVKADLRARVITVEGEVEGDLVAKEQVILKSSAQVQGDLTAPRVVLEDGATFRGLVDMGDPLARGEGSSGSSPGSGRIKASGASGDTHSTEKRGPSKVSGEDPKDKGKEGESASGVASNKS